MSTRGPYAKGVAKRREILDAALLVISREGYSNATVKQIADEVGLSQNGMLHYFESKDALFVEVLRLRDESDSLVLAERTRAAMELSLPRDLDELRDGIVGLVRHNADVAGLTHLFAHLSADAADPTHPSHDFFQQRYVDIRAFGRRTLQHLQQNNRIRQDVDIAEVATVIFALIDGLQLQWMYDDSIDIAAHLQGYLNLLRPAPPGR